MLIFGTTARLDARIWIDEDQNLMRLPQRLKLFYRRLKVRIRHAPRVFPSVKIKDREATWEKLSELFEVLPLIEMVLDLAVFTTRINFPAKHGHIEDEAPCLILEYAIPLDVIP